VIDFTRFQRIADEIGATVMVDMAAMATRGGGIIAATD
jgi:glycine/serine hydroxymethyltransferase